MNVEKIRALLQSIGNNINSLALQLSLLAESIEELIQENNRLRAELNKCKEKAEGGDK